MISSMRTSTDLDDKKEYDAVALDNQDGSSSSQEHPMQDQEKGPQDVGTALDEEQQDSRSIAESQLPPPPDGGLHAWLKVFGGFLIYINIWFVISLYFLTVARADDREGFHAIVRRLPILLLVYAAQLIYPIRHLMDRHCTIMASHFHRRALRPTLRHGLLPFHASCRQHSGRSWSHDVEPVYDLLAGVSGARCLHGCRRWTTLYSQPGAGRDMVREEAGNSFRNCYEWDRCW
jgi:hypothetical protein